jgi:DNA modification methylase
MVQAETLPWETIRPKTSSTLMLILCSMRSSLFESVGFSFHSDTTIFKDPVIEMQRTKAHGLLYKQLRKDSSFSRTGMGEFVVTFRKWKDRSNEHLVKPINWKTKENFELDKWQKYASPVAHSEMSKEDLLEVIYQQSLLLDKVEIPPHLRKVDAALMDIQQTNVLNIRQARENKDEKHICPLQLDLIKWAVEMWSNPNEVVFSPFAGIGSEGYESLKNNRKFVGIELKKEYFEIACKNLKSAHLEKGQVGLF